MKIYLILYACFAVLFLSNCNSKNGSSDKMDDAKPNIIYIMVDDLGYGDLGCYGQTKFETPNIDQLAKEGLMFTQHYAGSTVCAPSRCSLMSGHHTGHAFVRGNKEVMPEGQFPMADSVVTVAELLKKAGYTTAAIGKWGLGAPGSEGAPEKQGFDYFFGYNCQREAHHYYPEHLWRNEEKVIINENKDGQKGIYTHDLFADDALRFIRENKDKPFFLYLPFTIPHADVDVPENSLEKFRDKFDEIPFEGGHYIAQPEPLAAFAGMVTRMDGDVGRINNLLTELGIDEKTLLIFTSDNGPHLEGGHQPDFFDSNGPMKGYKRDVYEGGIRVPFIAKWAGTIQPGSKTDHISAFWDFLPTACEIAGAEIPSNIDGISYLPVLKGENQPNHEYLYWEFHEKGGRRAVRIGDWKAVQHNIFENTNAPIELYDLSTDIGEENNMAEQHPDIVQKADSLFKVAHVPNPIFKFPGE